MTDKFDEFKKDASIEILEFIKDTEKLYVELENIYSTECKNDAALLSRAKDFNFKYNKYCNYLKNKSRLFLKNTEEVDILVKDVWTGKNKKYHGKLITKNYKIASNIVSYFKFYSKDIFHTQLVEYVDRTLLKNKNEIKARKINYPVIYEACIKETINDSKYANFEKVTLRFLMNLTIAVEALKSIIFTE